MVESSKYKTFFDLGISDNYDDREFRTLRCLISSDKPKKRVINNRLIKKYLDNESLTKDELIRVKKILDGTIYQEDRNRFGHCRLCSDFFERKPLYNFSSKFKYWDICVPTFPYFPGGLMIYLKERKKLLIENVQDLPIEYLEELIALQNDLLYQLNDNYFNGSLVGINILFNQLSKSELCIHGHVEFMIKDIDQMGFGCKYVQDRPYDKLASIINRAMDNKYGMLKIKEGIRLNLNQMSLDDAKKTVGSYEGIINEYFIRGKALRNKTLEIENDIDLLLYNNMEPAATHFVYLTLYRNNIIISLVPEIILDFVPYEKIENNDEDLYSLKINRFYDDKNNVFMRNYSPLIRPSIKIYSPHLSKEKVLKLQKTIYNSLED